MSLYLRRPGKLRESFDEMTPQSAAILHTGARVERARRPGILDELPLLSDKVTIEDVNFVLEKIGGAH
jgi:hypothetical protein